MDLLKIGVCQYTQKKMIKKGLKCISPVSKLKSKGEIHLKEQRPAVLATHAGRLTTNDSRSIEV
ncbi:hypothetical protein FQZ98_28500, partial [Escherichia coli]|nr:hypothetical protein [Escherichia coli]